jgi:fatty acid desaturase
MSFAGLNYLAILVAAIASFAFGAVWYMSLGKQWMAALGKTEEQLIGTGGKPEPIPFVLAFLCQLVIAWVLAGIFGHLGQYSLRTGVISAFFIWMGFVATTLIVNHRFQKSPWSLTFIDGGHWLGVLLIQGAILGAWGV